MEFDDEIREINNSIGIFESDIKKDNDKLTSILLGFIFSLGAALLFNAYGIISVTFKGLFWSCSICSLTISSALFLECVEAIINRYNDKKELAGLKVKLEQLERSKEREKGIGSTKTQGISEKRSPIAPRGEISGINYRPKHNGKNNN